jgi:hypothetical protein
MPADHPTPWVARSIDELIAGATERTPVRPSDGKSGSEFERLRLDGASHFLKVLSAEQDWIMRVTGNTTNWEFRVWSAGLYQQVPGEIDHAIVGMALDGTGPSARLAILMEDRADDLVPPGDDVLPLTQHRRFIDHLAAFHAAFLGWHDRLGLQDLARRFRFFAPDNIAGELAVDEVPVPVAVAGQGWQVLPDRSPDLDALARRVHKDPDALAEALRETPQTFVAGDWKLGNLGSRPNGQTIVLDWAYPGEAPPCWELMWYLALNSARLPESKEDTIAHFRAALEQAGVDTTGWWERQLGLCCVGIMATFAWEKAIGDSAELAWWERRTLDAARQWW